ncbi:YceI family protein [Roseateles sp.]|uniref:YceI family protein n=1 Tax=Roseateles sp. TaxID=1971397 RepID=UPI003BA4A2DE
MKNILTLAALAALSTTASLAHAQAATYAVDPTHTFVTYEISHFGTSTNRGRFDKKEGSVKFDRAAKTGRVEISFPLASVSTGVAAMDKHLQGEDFFLTEKFPTATFIGDKFVFNGDKVSEVQGQLTLRGKTNPVSLKATQFNCYDNPIFKREVCGGDFEATIDRTQWGIDYGLAWGFPKNVKLIIQVEAIKQ